jgi:TolB-like protein
VGLPFTNICGDPEQEFFAAGLVKEIIAAAVVGHLRIASGMGPFSTNESQVRNGLHDDASAKKLE